MASFQFQNRFSKFFRKLLTLQCRLLLSRSNNLHFCSGIPLDNEFNPASLGIYRSFHGKNSSEATEITSIPNYPNSDVESLKIVKEAERICKLLSRHHFPASIDAAMSTWAIEINPLLVQEVLKKLSNSGLLALSFFRWSEKQKGYESCLESYNALIEALGKIKQFKMVWNLVEEMKRQGILSKGTFALISRRYARARKVKEAVYAFKRMNEFGLIPELNDYNRLIDTLCKSRNVKTAQEVFDKWKNRVFKPDIKSYTILLEGWGQEQNLVRLNEVYREMKDDGFDPDVVSYGIMIHAYCKAKKFEEAVELYQELEGKNNIKATPHIYCTLINSLGSEKKLSEALEFFELAKTSGQALESPTYNAVVGAYCWSNRMDDAYRIMEEMRRYKIGPNSRTYDIILHHLIKARRTQEAYRVFLKMYQEFGCEPTVSSYEIIVRMFCKEGRTDLALKVWDQMKGKGIIPGMHMFSTLINSLCFENRLDDACEYFEMMLDMGIRPSTAMFSRLKQCLLEEGKQDVVIALNNRLEKLRRTQIIG